jgi:Amt family ammonium transporter
MTDLKMSKVLGAAALASLALALPAFAQDAAAPVAEAAAEVTPIIDKGDTAWMLVSTMVVFVMIVPGLALFYGGLVRAKNVLSILSQVLAGVAMIALLWVAYGYSLAFGGTEGGLSAIIGDFSKLFLSGVTIESTAATFSAGFQLPELVFVVFQLTFACITSTLIVGGIAERMKFGAVMLFLAIWFTFSYLPIAHMVWAGTGYLFNLGAYDFAGGTVVHINSGVAALIAAIVPRAAHRFPQGTDPAAQPDLRLHRRGPALVRLVRLQCRLEPRSQRPHRPGLPQHHHRSGRRGPGLGSC